MEATHSLQRRDGVVLDGRGFLPGARLTDDNRRIYRALAYDITSVDRHGSTIAGSAFRAVNLDNFPLILWHSDNQFPVGRVIEWTMTEQGPVAGFVFADTAEAREAELLVATGFLNGVSIGFLGYEAENQNGVTVFTDVEVVELSLTPTPSSRAALVNLERSIRAWTVEGDYIAEETPAVEVVEQDAPAVETADTHCECCSLRFKTGELVNDVPAETEAETEAEAATVANDESRTFRLASLLNRLR